MTAVSENFDLQRLILVQHIEPGPRDAEKTINDLLSVLYRNNVVGSVWGCGLPKTHSIPRLLFSTVEPAFGRIASRMAYRVFWLGSVHRQLTA
jgi:hypothetical protein